MIQLKMPNIDSEMTMPNIIFLYFLIYKSSISMILQIVFCYFKTEKYYWDERLLKHSKLIITFSNDFNFTYV